MTRLIELALGVVDKLIGALLDWPFLLFVLVVWMAVRYRDQIGSILDRRGAVPAGELIKAVRRELEPMAKQVADMSVTLSELRCEVEKAQAAYSEDRVARLLAPVNRKVQDMDAVVTALKTETERTLKKDLPEILSRDREAAQAELNKLGSALQAQGTTLEGRATTAAVAELAQEMAKALEGLRSAASDLAAVKDGLGRVEQSALDGLKDLDRRSADSVGAVGNDLAAVKTAVERVHSDLQGLASKEVETKLRAEFAESMDKVGAKVGTLESAIASVSAEAEGRVQARLAAISEEIQTFKTLIDALRSELKASTAKDLEDGVAAAVAPLSTDLGELKETLASLETRVKSETGEAQSRLFEELASLAREVDLLKAAPESAPAPAAEEPPAEAPTGPAVAAAPAKTDAGPKGAIKKALMASGPAGRRVDALAKSVGIPEDQARQILETDPEFTLGMNSKGKTIAKLAKR